MSYKENETEEQKLYSFLQSIGKELQKVGGKLSCGQQLTSGQLYDFYIEVENAGGKLLKGHGEMERLRKERPRGEKDGL